MLKCCYKDCDSEATSEGVVFARNPEGGAEIPTTVHACDIHKNVSGYFESKKLSK